VRVGVDVRCLKISAEVGGEVEMGWGVKYEKAQGSEVSVCVCGWGVCVVLEVAVRQREQHWTKVHSVQSYLLAWKAVFRHDFRILFHCTLLSGVNTVQ
jgi:hypothetical protein